MRLLSYITKSIFGLKQPNDDFQIINGEVRENPQKHEENHAKRPSSVQEENTSAHPPPNPAKDNHEPETDPSIEEIQAKKGRLPKIDRFFTFLTSAGRSKRTIQEYKYEFRWWTREAEKLKKTLYTITISDIENILGKIHPSTTRRKISFLRTLSKWYLREGKNRLYVEVSKFTVPKIPQRLPDDHGATKFEEIKKQAKELCEKQERIGVWFGLMLMCGLRISEIQTATIKDDHFIKVLGKGNKERLVPVPLWLLDSMNQIERDSKNGWAKNRNIVYRHVKKLGYKPHSLRHTYASELLRRGEKIETIKVLLGHTDISTTSIYARVNISADSALLLDS